MVRRLERGSLRSHDAYFYEKAGEDGTRKLYLYPAPTEATTLELEYVFRPAALVNDSDTPTEIPEDFHEKLLHFAAVTYYRTVEDNPELANDNERLVNEAIAALQRYDNIRSTGESPWTVGIVGLTA
jgi:hypothetical protein